MAGEIFDENHVADLFGISRIEVIRQVRQGRLRCNRWNRVTFRFTQEMIDEFVELSSRPAPEPPESAPNISAKMAARYRRRAGA
jgi:hypothetical protein